MTERSRGSAHILVADDDDAVRESTADILEAEGYTVTQASQVNEVVDQLGAGHVDLLILDLGLGSHPERGPSQAGLEVLDRVAQLPPVIFVSGSVLPPRPDPRVAGFFPKPVAPRQLLREVARLLRA